jgi:DNA polymerase-3 subunit alpha
MAELFADAPELLRTRGSRQALLAADPLGSSMLPAYPVPAGSTTEQDSCARSRSAASRRGSRRPGPRPARRGARRPAKGYAARLELELGVICSMGFAGYFLIVADFIRWARENGVPVGPGRGSGAGSLVAYVLGITDLDPIEHDLLFERFLNPERVSMPDFDVDFCMEGRDRVIEYVAKKYGRERVSQIITYGTWRRRPWCATSAGCSATTTATSTRSRS